MSWFIDESNIEQVPFFPTFLVYGDTGDGKTTLLGEYAESVFTRGGKVARVYTADPGRWEPIRPYVRAGVIEIVNLVGMPRPWEWVSKVVKGEIPVGRDGEGNPVWQFDPVKNARVGLWAFEGMTAFSDVLMQDAARQAIEGRNIGGRPPAFKYSEGTAKWAGNSESHYGSVQTVINIAVQESFRLPGEVWWSAMARRTTDQDSNTAILGPQVAGKALTPDVPRWFTYTFRAMSIPADELSNRASEHRLYIEDHTERNTPGAKGLGNSRMPLDAEPVLPYVAPASVVKALALIEKGQGEAFEKIRARVAAARGGRG